MVLGQTLTMQALFYRELSSFHAQYRHDPCKEHPEFRPKVRPALSLDRSGAEAIQTARTPRLHVHHLQFAVHPFAGEHLASSQSIPRRAG